MKESSVLPVGLLGGSCVFTGGCSGCSPGEWSGGFPGLTQVEGCQTGRGPCAVRLVALAGRARPARAAG
eukprot:15457042-Alexandrium_andersonii.AAC.1